MSKVVIIGAGASGILAALRASKKNDVTIIEGNDKIGKKILITGNGKCNFWNDKINISKYNTDNREILDNILKNKEIVYNYLIRDLGIYPYTKSGYIYPASQTAASINETFKRELAKNNIEVLFNLKVVDIIPNKNNVELILSDSTKIVADNVIIATGSKAAFKTGSDGSGYELLSKLNLNINQISPSLVPLISDDKFLGDWKNIRTNVKLKIKDDDKIIKEEVGEIQLTDYGISGIVTFNISSLISNTLINQEKTNVYIDFFPYNDNIFDILNKKNEFMGNPSIEALLETMFHYKLIHIFLSLANIDKNAKWNSIKDKSILVNIIKNFRLNIIGTKDYDQAQVCRGGLSLKEIDNTFKLNKYKNISVIGELLDVDGICGGYNLAFAFISGYLAGEHIDD